MKNIITILILLVAVGCGKTEVKKLEPQSKAKQFKVETRKITAEEEKLVGSYDNTMSVSEGLGEERVVFLKNGTVESYLNGKKVEVEKWKLVGKEVHTGDEMITCIYKIEPNGDLTWFAWIIDGKRTDRRQVTFKKLKE